jgi:alginate O-acetyltransferase complex protein AlgJ
MVTSHEPEMTREERAQRDMALTVMSGAIARFLLAAFVAVIAAVPLLELARSLRGEAPASWAELRGMPDEVSAGVATARMNGGSLWRQIVAANNAVRDACRRFEDALEDASVIGDVSRPYVQLALTAWFGAGTEGVFPGRSGWLFYAPDVHYVTGAGFLEPRVLERRARTSAVAGQAVQPDPRPAILAFKRDLEARGISLIVVPTPVKPTVHPEKLSRRYGAEGPRPDNPSYAPFVEQLRRDGVLVFDPAEAFPTAGTGSGTGAPSYLATDTHWRPEAMQQVAQRLAEYLRARVPLSSVPRTGDVAEVREVQQLGDVGVMLDLPEGQTRYPPEAVTVRRVTHADGAVWRPSTSADVLLLGDSFTNIYSLSSLGWGDGAGFAEQLSFELERPLDRITQNDEGAHATRAALRRAGDDRLAGKRVVIYQFAARELSLGDWKMPSASD